MLRGEIVFFSCFLMILHHVNSRKKAEQAQAFFFPLRPTVFSAFQWRSAVGALGIRLALGRLAEWIYIHLLWWGLFFQKAVPRFPHTLPLCIKYKCKLRLLKGYYFGCAPKYIPEESRHNEGKISKA